MYEKVHAEKCSLENELFDLKRINEDREKELQAGKKIGHIHLRWLHPFPSNLETILQQASTVMTAELNLGQLQRILRGEFLIDVKVFSKVQGQPFKVSELRSAFQQHY